MNHPEVATLDDQRAAAGGEGLLLHRRYVVVQNLCMTERERTIRERGEKQKDGAQGAASARAYLLWLHSV